MITFTDMTGYTAAIITTGSFLPQVIKVVKTNDTKALSASTYVFLTFGVCTWTVYGLLKGDMAVILANIAIGSLSSIILVKKIRNDGFK